MPDKKLISIIVPVFNVKDTLENCLDSLMNQGLDDGSYEVILINDGSTDGSEELCHSLSVIYPCVRVFSQENKGLSEARNSGIRVANGEYLCFVDADDCLTPSGLSSLVPLCNGEIDVIRYWIELVLSRSEPSSDLGDGRILFTGKGKEYLRENGLETFCVNCLYRKSFLDHNYLRFKPGIIGEDFLFMFNVMMANPQIVSVARRIYRYFIKPDSLSTIRTAEHSRRWVNDMKDTMTGIRIRLSDYRDSDPVLFSRCHGSLDGKTVALFSRVLSSDYTIGEFRSFLDSCHEIGILPFQTRPSGLKNRLLRLAVKMLDALPFLYPLAGRFYTNVFIPFVYPKIDRNK